MFLQLAIGVIIHNLDNASRKQTGLDENHAVIIRHWRRRVNCYPTKSSQNLRKRFWRASRPWFPRRKRFGRASSPWFPCRKLGKTNLTDAAWRSPANSAHRFFKVKVALP